MFKRSELSLSSLFLSTILLLLTACGGGEDRASDSGGGSEAQEKTIKPAVCVWQGTPVRKSAGKEGEWITNLNMGESFKALGKTQKASTGDEKKEYQKIRMKGGDEGWTRSDLIVVDAKPRVVTEEAELHERPDAMSAQGDKAFEALDIVASMKSEGDWLQVKGKRRKGDWIEKSWIKKEHISDQKDRITLAGLYHRAIKKKKGEEREEQLRDLLEEHGTGGPLEEAIRERHLQGTDTDTTASAGEPSSLELTESNFGPLQLMPPKPIDQERLRKKFPELTVEKKRGQQDGPDFTFYRIRQGEKIVADLKMDPEKERFKLLTVKHEGIIDHYGVSIGMPYQKIQKLRPGMDRRTDYHTYVTAPGSQIAYEIDGEFDGPDRREFEDETVQDWKVTKMFWGKEVLSPSKRG